MRSTDNGSTWSDPVLIGEGTAEARQQIAAADGQIFAIWQREGDQFGEPLPADRLAYNRSLDGGETWLGPELLPHDTGIDRNHQQIWLTPGGQLHIAWTHGVPTDASSPTGYLFSPDYGETWIDGSEIAVDLLADSNLPHSIVADENFVHVMVEPGIGAFSAGTYARRAVIPEPASLALLGLGAIIMLRRARSCL